MQFRINLLQSHLCVLKKTKPQFSSSRKYSHFIDLAEDMLGHKETLLLLINCSTLLITFNSICMSDCKDWRYKEKSYQTVTPLTRILYAQAS